MANRLLSKYAVFPVSNNHNAKLNHSFIVVVVVDADAVALVFKPNLATTKDNVTLYVTASIGM